MTYRARSTNSGVAFPICRYTSPPVRFACARALSRAIAHGSRGFLTATGDMTRHSSSTRSQRGLVDEALSVGSRRIRMSFASLYAIGPVYTNPRPFLGDTASALTTHGSIRSITTLPRSRESLQMMVTVCSSIINGALQLGPSALSTQSSLRQHAIVEEILVAGRAGMALWHSDRKRSSEPHVEASRINQAWNRLKDSETRRAYDERLRANRCASFHQLRRRRVARLCANQWRRNVPRSDRGLARRRRCAFLRRREWWDQSRSALASLTCFGGATSLMDATSSADTVSRCRHSK